MTKAFVDVILKKNIKLLVITIRYMKFILPSDLGFEIHTAIFSLILLFVDKINDSSTESEKKNREINA